MKAIKYIFILSCFLGSPLFGQLSEAATVSLLTCRQGDDAYNTFGHTAIHIIDPVTKKNEIYNYGLFSFKEPGFLSKFLRGKLLYWLGIQSQKDFIDNYAFEKRSIYKQILNLNTEQKNNIYQKIRENYKPENRKYKYDFFFDNCSTRPRDIILKNIDHVSIDTASFEVKSFRNLLDEFTEGSPWMDFGIDLILGKVADRKAYVNDQMFLPSYLYRALENTTINGTPLIKSSGVMLDFESEVDRRRKSSWLSPTLLGLILLLLEFYLFSKYRKLESPKWLKRYDKFWYLIAGISSIIILFMWLGTDHIPTKSNWNVLWLSPLYLVRLFSHSRWIQIAIGVTLTLAMLVTIFQIQSFHAVSLALIVLLILKFVRNQKIMG